MSCRVSRLLESLSVGTKEKEDPAGLVTRPHSTSGGVGLPREHRVGTYLWPGPMGLGGGREATPGGVKAVLYPGESDQGNF